MSAFYIYEINGIYIIMFTIRPTHIIDPKEPILTFKLKDGVQP